MKILSIFLLLLDLVFNIEFKKNSDIINAPKSSNPNVKEVEDLKDILNLISQHSNFITVFHADWCYHWYVSF
jgi:hypothetical protein